MSRIKNHTTTLTTDQEVDAALKEFSDLQARKKVVDLTLTKSVEAVTQQAMKELVLNKQTGETVMDRMQAISANIEAYLLEHQPEFATQRTRSLNFGQIGFRFGQPKVEAKGKLTFKSLLDIEAAVAKLKTWKWLRFTTALDKEAILKAHANDAVATAAKLAEVSLSVTQDDAPWFEVREQEVQPS